MKATRAEAKAEIEWMNRMTKTELIRQLRHMTEDRDYLWGRADALDRLNRGQPPDFRANEELRLKYAGLQVWARHMEEAIAKERAELKEWKDRYYELLREHSILKERSEREEWAARGLITLRGLF